MKLQVIVGSVRQGRTTPQISKWVAAEAERQLGCEVEVVDLADYPLPFFEEPVSPQYNPDRQPSDATKKWLDKVAEADAYILVTPEYNRATSAVLKNALDYLDFQFARKPVALVGHGSTGGAQAIASLRIALPGVLAVSVPKATFLIGASNFIDENGTLNSEVAAQPYGPLTALSGMLEDLKWYSDAMSAARNAAKAEPAPAQ